MLLTCSDNLVVWTRKMENGPAQQSMHAHGNAYLQNEEYEGWGSVSSERGTARAALRMMKDNLARIKSRFGGTEQPGEIITYDAPPIITALMAASVVRWSRRAPGRRPPKGPESPVTPNSESRPSRWERRMVGAG